MLSGDGLKKTLQTRYNPFLNNRINPFSTQQNRASQWFCNFATTGTGSQFPVIIFPRLIPIIQLPIPRAFLRWNAAEGITSCGGLRSGKGFIAYGQQTGTALGFWGIGFSVFLPPFQQYGFIGYALYATAETEEIELWPPNSPPTISQINPNDGEIDVSVSLSELSFRIDDADGDLMSYTVTTTPDIGSGSGNLKPDGIYSISVGGLVDLTEYSWRLEVTDGIVTTVGEFTFTTEAEAPIVSDPIPEDGSRHTSIDLTHLSFHLEDFQEDPMDYTVETSPDIGSGGDTGVGNGIYSISINELDFDTEYTWFVNATDGTHWMNKVYHFKTQKEPGPWWDETWLYRKYLGIMDASSDYQLNLQIWKENDHDNPEDGNIDCEDHCNENFSDIRFVTFDGVECKYWIQETGADSGDHYAIIWVKTPSSGDEEIYLYYGNPDATDESSGDDTFIFFDDFEIYDTDIWDEYDPSDKLTVTAEAGLLHMAFGSLSTGTSAGVQTRSSVAEYGLTVAKVKGEIGSNDWNMPFRILNKVDPDNYLENLYRNTGDHSEDRNYHRNFRHNGITDQSHYSSEGYPSLDWRVIYLKKLINFQAAGIFRDHYNGARVGSESKESHTIDGPFTVAMYVRSFDSGLDSYCDWIFVAKCTITEPTWEIFGEEENNGLD